MAQIHLLNPFENAFGGSERRTLALAKMLKGHAPVKVWSLEKPDSKLPLEVSITAVDVGRMGFPKGGTFVFVGCYFPLPAWLSVANPNRIVLIYNIPFEPQLRRCAYELAALGLPLPEVVAASQTLAKDVERVGLPLAGVEPSWIDLNRFRPSVREVSRPFTVGRHSRDVVEKFHDEDPALFRRLAAGGIPVSILGGTCLAESLAGCPDIQLMKVGQKPPEAFLAGIDAFLYRTHEQWAEAWGRVVGEAMACGKPVVLHRKIGFVEALSPGEDCLAFDATEEAYDLVLRLRGDSGLRKSLGTAARATVERIYGPDVRQRWIEFYTRQSAV